MRRSLVLLGLLLLCGQSACSTYLYGYDYAPRPHETQLRVRSPATAAPDTDQEKLLARVLTSVIGIQRASKETDNEERVHVRFLIENLTDQPMTLDTDQCQLATADLRICLSPIVEPSANPEIAPGAIQEVNLFYSLPAGLSELNLGGLNLKWTVTLNGNEITRSSTFERLIVEPTPYYFYDGFYGFGYGCCYRRFCW